MRKKETYLLRPKSKTKKKTCEDYDLILSSILTKKAEASGKDQTKSDKNLKEDNIFNLKRNLKESTKALITMSNDKGVKSPGKSRVVGKDRSPKEDAKSIIINKVITVDLTREEKSEREKSNSKIFKNTKIVNLDLFSSRESFSSKNLNHCKSEILIDYNENTPFKKKKFIHVPTVETKLYSDQISQDSNERQVSRNSSISLRNARSKRKVASSTNDSLNESQDSLSEKHIINSLNQQLDELKSFNKRKEDRSVSPVTINYKSFRDKISTSQIENKQRTYSNDTRNSVISLNSSDNIFTFKSGQQSIRFLNLVRSQVKKEDQE